MAEVLRSNLAELDLPGFAANQEDGEITINLLDDVIDPDGALTVANVAISTDSNAHSQR